MRRRPQLPLPSSNAAVRAAAAHSTMAIASAPSAVVATGRGGGSSTQHHLRRNLLNTSMYVAAATTATSTTMTATVCSRRSFVSSTTAAAAGWTGANSGIESDPFFFSAAGRRDQSHSSDQQQQQQPGPRSTAFKAHDWLCPGCGTHNFARRHVCMACSTERPATGGPTTTTSTAAPTSTSMAGHQHRGDGGGVRNGAQNSRRGGAVDGPVEGGDMKSVNITIGTGDRVVVMKKGDWLCPRCTAHNFAKRGTCMSCAEPRPEMLIQSSQQHQHSSSTFTRGAPKDNSSSDAAPLFDDGQATTQIKKEKRGGAKSAAASNDISDVIATQYEMTPRQELLFAGLLDMTLPPPKPGDWRCPGCKYVNFSARESCKQCNLERNLVMTTSSDAPQEGHENPHIFTQNDVAAFILQRKLKQLNASKRPSKLNNEENDDELLAASHQRKQRSSINTNNTFQRGDWYCGKCDFHNFATRSHCHRCGFLKDIANNTDSNSGGSSSNRNSSSTTSLHSSSQQRQDDEALGLEKMLSDVLGL